MPEAGLSLACPADMSPIVLHVAPGVWSTAFLLVAAIGVLLWLARAHVHRTGRW